MKTRSTNWKHELVALEEELDSIQRLTLHRVLRGVRKEAGRPDTDVLVIVAIFMAGFAIGFASFFAIGSLFGLWMLDVGAA